MGNKKRLICSLAVLGAAIMLAGCTGLDANDTIGPGEYVFVEHYIETRAELVDNPGADAYVYMGYPTYNASTSQSILSSSMFPRINESLKAILAQGRGIGKAGCHGGEMYLYGTYSLPYQTNNVTITGLDGQGTAYIEYEGKSLVLPPGSTWYDNSSRVELIHFKNDTRDEYIKVNLSITDRMRNFGTYKKGDSA